MDNFCEQIITIKNTRKKVIFKLLMAFLIILIGVAIFYITWLFINFIIAFLLLCGIISLGIFLLNSTNYEYEYIFTNGELDIDKIIAKRKRKRILNVEVRNFSNFGKAEEILNKKDRLTKINADDGITENIFFAEFNCSETGQTRLFFSPNDKLLNNFKKYLPRNLRNI